MEVHEEATHVDSARAGESVHSETRGQRMHSLAHGITLRVHIASDAFRRLLA